MKKKNTAKKAVLPALLAVLCSTAALTSVSYAWFTMGNTAEVGQVDLTVDAADGMQISVDAVNWKSVVSVDELKSYAVQEVKQNNFPEKVNPLSTDCTVSNGVHTFYEGTYDQDGTTVIAKEATEKDYVQFDLYVKLDVAKQFQLNTGSAVTSKAIEGTDTTETHLASRVSFVNLGNASTPTAALALTGSADSEVKVWEPNADQHTDASMYRDTTIKDGTAVAYNGVSGLDTTEVGEGYYKALFSSEAISTYQTTVANGVATPETLFNLEAGINKVRVFIWLEGQDVDCLNDVANATLQTTLKFVAINVASTDESNGEENA